jgi:cellulose synthase/poly-beta-1,6-N-acetylglucosamine synthase-like glycosyltransferase
VTALAPTRRRGKTACLADAIARARGEVLVFTDVRQRFAPGAVRALIAALGDPRVGAAGGELHLRDADGFARTQDAYWRYERWIRRNESRSGSVMGVSGALYAVRRADMPLPPPGLVLDDLWVPLKLMQRGLRVVLVGAAIAWDEASRDPRAEAARKRRTLAGNWQLIARWPQLLVPGLAPSWWRLVSHKWLRLAMPAALLVLLGASFALASESAFVRFALVAQLVAYGAALAAIARPALRRIAPLRYAAAFLELNASAALALPDALRTRDAHLWGGPPRAGLERRP